MKNPHIKIGLNWMVLTALALGAMFLAGSYGFGAGEHTQYKRDIATVQDFFKEHQQAIIFMTPNHRAVAILKDGVCVPYPQDIPQDYHLVWVSPVWEPCSSKTLALYDSPEHVRKRLAGLSPGPQR